MELSRRLILFSTLAAIVLASGETESLLQKSVQTVVQEKTLIALARKYLGPLSDTELSADQASIAIASTIRGLLKVVHPTSFTWQHLFTKQQRIALEQEYQGLDNAKMEQLMTDAVNKAFPSVEEIAHLGAEERVKVFLQNVPQVQQRMIEILTAGYVAKFTDIAFDQDSQELVFHRLAAVALSAISEHLNRFRVGLNQEIKEHFNSIHAKFVQAEETLFNADFVEVKNLLSLVVNPVFVVKNRLESLMTQVDKSDKVEVSLLKGKLRFALELFELTCFSNNKPASYFSIRKRLLRFGKDLLHNADSADQRKADLRRFTVGTFFRQIPNNLETEKAAFELAQSLLKIMFQWNQKHSENFENAVRVYAEKKVRQQLASEGKGHESVDSLTRALFLITADPSNDHFGLKLHDFDSFFGLDVKQINVLTETKLFLLHELGASLAVADFERVKIDVLLRFSALAPGLSLLSDSDAFFDVFRFINMIVKKEVDVGSHLLADTQKYYPFLVVQALAYRRYKFIVEEDGTKTADLAEDDRTLVFHNIFKQGKADPNWTAFVAFYHSSLKGLEVGSELINYLAVSFLIETEQAFDPDNMSDEETLDALFELITTERNMGVNSAWVYAREEENAETNKLNDSDFESDQLRVVKVRDDKGHLRVNFDELRKEDPDHPDLKEDDEEEDQDDAQDDEDLIKTVLPSAILKSSEPEKDVDEEKPLDKEDPAKNIVHEHQEDPDLNDGEEEEDSLDDKPKKDDEEEEEGPSIKEIVGTPEKPLVVEKLEEDDHEPTGPSVGEIVGTPEQPLVIKEKEEEQPVVPEDPKIHKVVVEEPADDKQHKVLPSILEIVGHPEEVKFDDVPDEQPVKEEEHHQHLSTPAEAPKTLDPPEEIHITVNEHKVLPSVLEIVGHPEEDKFDEVPEEQPVNPSPNKLNDAIKQPAHKDIDEETPRNIEHFPTAPLDLELVKTSEDKKNIIEHFKGFTDPETAEIMKKIEDAPDLTEFIQELKIEVDPVTGDEIHYHLIHVVPYKSDCYEALTKQNQ